MDANTPTEPLILPESVIADGDGPEVIETNIEIVNMLTRQGVPHAAIAPAALASYALDYYVTQVENGGFAQFIHNAGADPTTLETVGAGLSAIGATRHAALYDRALARLKALTPETLEGFLHGGLFGDNPVRDGLNADAETLFALEGIEDIRALNAAWLRGHPNLEAVADADFEDALFGIIARHGTPEPVPEPGPEPMPARHEPATASAPTDPMASAPSAPQAPQSLWRRFLNWFGFR